jgi:hypothetical protein
MQNVAADSDLQQSPLDAAMICLDRMHALAELLAVEEVASAFASLSIPAQVALFGTLEAGINEARDAITQAVTRPLVAKH